MQFTFDLKQAAELVKKTKAASAHRASDFSPNGPCLWLVEDECVYMMSSAEGCKDVVYADECDPKKSGYETWRHNEKSSFGVDDGADYISGDSLDNILEASEFGTGHVAIDFLPDNFEMTILVRRGELVSH